MKTPTTLKRAGLLALCLCAGEALADARLEARRHFRNGMSLIAQKQYDQGIAELEAAYAIKPHANVLYNIARAYHDAGRLTEALDAYQRYLASNPPDSGSVVATVAALEEKLKAGGDATASASPEDKSALPMPPPPASIQAQQQLGVLLERLEKAIERAESMPAPGTSTAAPTPTVSAQAGGAEAVAMDEGAVPYEERVVTASRRAQSSLEAPNATTVITAEDIRLSGATSLPELLRRVPGADVMSLGVGSANVSLRGFNQRIANKVLVLVDGRTEYQDFLGLTLWSSIPIGLEEIERIEVIRGPGSALYGANAMLGVINIITQAPGSGPRARFSATGGTGNTVAGSFLSHGSSGRMRYRAAVAYSQADKWSRDFDSGRPDMELKDPDPDIGIRGARATLSTVYTFDEGRQVGLSGGVHRYTTEIYPLGLLRNYFMDGVNAYAKGDVEVGPLKLKTFWNHISGDAGPQYEAIGQRSLGTSLTSNLFNAEVLFARAFDLGGIHQLNVGVEGRLKRVAWNYLGPLRQEVHAAAFIQDEWQLVEPLRLVASYRVDRHPLLDNGSPGLAHSPRISALFLPFEGHAFRASAAAAFREPTFLESYTRIPVPVPGVNGASALTTGSTQLRAERLTAFELGWRGEAAEVGVDWDVALYQNTVRDLIGLSAVQRLENAGDSYDAETGSYLLGISRFQNEDSVYTARGVEAGVNMAPVDGLGLKLSAAFQNVTSDSEEKAQCGPCSQAPQLKLYGGVTYRTRADLEFGVDAAFTTASTWIEREPAAADPTRIVLLSNPLAAHAVINARVGYEAVKNTVDVALVGSHLGGSHAQHPFGNRIERRVYATLTVTP